MSEERKCPNCNNFKWCYEFSTYVEKENDNMNSCFEPIPTHYDRLMEQMTPNWLAQNIKKDCDLCFELFGITQSDCKGSKYCEETIVEKLNSSVGE